MQNDDDDDDDDDDNDDDDDFVDSVCRSPGAAALQD